MEKLTLDFYEQPVVTVAQELLGKVVVRHIDGRVHRARIVETEAYPGGEDKASHTHGGLRTDRTETLYMRSGHLYVYLIYGMYHLMNVVSGPEHLGGGVMLRATEVEEDDLESAARLRFDRTYDELSSYQRRNLTNGPGKLTQTLEITTAADGTDLLKDEIYLVDDGYRDFNIHSAQRIGIDYAGEDAKLPYRFYIEGNPNVSRK